MHEHTLRKPAQWITAIALDTDTDAKEHKTWRAQLHRVNVSYHLSL